MAQINERIANKQMHGKQKTSILFPKQDNQNAKRTEKKKHIDKEQGKTKHEAPRSVNYRATQNKNNIGITALERPSLLGSKLQGDEGKHKIPLAVTLSGYLLLISLNILTRIFILSAISNGGLVKIPKNLDTRKK